MTKIKSLFAVKVQRMMCAASFSSNWQSRQAVAKTGFFKTRRAAYVKYVSTGPPSPWGFGGFRSLVRRSFSVGGKREKAGLQTGFTRLR
jgi:hypothetical protein